MCICIYTNKQANNTLILQNIYCNKTCNISPILYFFGNVKKFVNLILHLSALSSITAENRIAGVSGQLVSISEKGKHSKMVAFWGEGMWSSVVIGLDTVVCTVPNSTGRAYRGSGDLV